MVLFEAWRQNRATFVLTKMRLDQCALIDKYTDSRTEDYYRERQDCVRQKIEYNGGDLESAMGACQNVYQADLKNWAGRSSGEKTHTNKLIECAVERDVVLAENDELKLKDMLQPMAGLESNNKSTTPIQVQEIYKMFDLTLNDAKKSFEKEYVEHWLKETRGNISALARRTGRYRADIYRLIERYKIDAKLIANFF